MRESTPHIRDLPTFFDQTVALLHAALPAEDLVTGGTLTQPTPAPTQERIASDGLKQLSFNSYPERFVVLAVFQARHKQISPNSPPRQREMKLLCPFTAVSPSQLPTSISQFFNIVPQWIISGLPGLSQTVMPTATTGQDLETGVRAVEVANCDIFTLHEDADLVVRDDYINKGLDFSTGYWERATGTYDKWVRDVQSVNKAGLETPPPMAGPVVAVIIVTSKADGRPINDKIGLKKRPRDNDALAKLAQTIRKAREKQRAEEAKQRAEEAKQRAKEEKRRAQEEAKAAKKRGNNGKGGNGKGVGPSTKPIPATANGQGKEKSR